MSKSLEGMPRQGRSLGSQIMSLKTKREVSEDEYVAFLSERERQKERRVKKIQDYLNGKRSLRKGANED